MSKLRDFVKAYWPFMPAGAGPLILFAPFLLGRQVLYWGTPLFQFYPWRKLAIDQILGGRLPLWNPYVGNGAPLIANYQSAVFYPPNWLSWVLPLAYSFSWLVVLHLIWAAFGMICFTRALGLKPFGQAISGLAFGMSQYLVTRAAFLSFNAALAWIPWILWAAKGLLEAEESRQSLRYALWLSLFTAFQLLAGHAQTGWYTLLLLAAWSLYWLFTKRPIRLARSGLLAAALLISAGLACIQLLPTAEFLSQSSRAGDYEYQAAVAYSYAPARLLTLLAPDLFGNPARGLFFGYGYYWEDADYIGVLPLLLGLGLVVRAVRSMRRSTISGPDTSQASLPRSLIFFLFAGMLVAFLLALGKNTLIFPFLYQHVPSFNMFQAPTRLMIWFEFSLAVLAGLAADLWQPPQGKSLYWTRLGLAGAFTLAVLGWLAYWQVPVVTKIDMQIHAMARAIGLAGVWLFLAALLALIQPGPGSPRRSLWSLGVVVLVGLDLLIANWNINPGAPPQIYTDTFSNLPATADSPRWFTYPAEDTQAKYNLFLTFKSFGSPDLAYQIRAAEMANVNLLDGIPSANNYDPLVVARYVQLMKALDSDHNQNVLDLMDIGRIASLQEDNTLQSGPSGGHPGRIWVVTTAQIVENADAALQSLFKPGFDPAATVILEADDPGIAAKHALPSPPITPPTPSPRIVFYSAEDVTIVATLPIDGWIVLSDTWYPGWAVYVDGRPAELLHADYAFRGVAMPQGTHRIEFRYEPASFVWGLGISSLSLIVYLGLLIFNHRSARGRKNPDSLEVHP